MHYAILIKFKQCLFWKELGYQIYEHVGYDHDNNRFYINIWSIWDARKATGYDYNLSVLKKRESELIPFMKNHTNFFEIFTKHYQTELTHSDHAFIEEFACLQHCYIFTTALVIS